MRNFILSAIAVLCMSVSFATTANVELTNKLEVTIPVETTISNEVDDAWYWCVAYYSETTYNFMDNSYTVTTYYACTKVEL